MRLEGYVFRQVTGLDRDPKLDVVNGLILHVSASATATSLFNFFNGPSNGIESHAHIPKSPDFPKEQYRDTDREADANYLANSWIANGKRHGFLSVETQGGADGQWNDYQLDQIKDLILQTSRYHDYPLQIPQQYHGKGVGFHTQFPEWSNVRGKVCPGKNRIEQYHDIIVPWMRELNVKEYVVKEGDTVRKICLKFGLDVVDLWRLNPATKIPFRVGQRVRVR